MNEKIYILVVITALAMHSGLFAFSPTESQRAAWIPVGILLKEKGRDAFPELARFLSTNDCTFPYYEAAMCRICIPMDGWVMNMKGSPDLLAMTRKYINDALETDKLDETPAVYHGLVYLAQKGNAGDLILMSRYFHNPAIETNKYVQMNFERTPMPYRVLQARVAETNIIAGLFGQERGFPEFSIDPCDWFVTNHLYFLPSVANTGPQAKYVYETYWHAIALKGGFSSRDTPYSIITNVAPELLTMRVWFDAKGKAVTDTDLSKYGISVPGLGLASLDSITNAPPAEPPQKPIPALPAKEKVPAVPLILGMGVLAGLLLVVRFLKRR